MTYVTVEQRYRDRVRFNAPIREDNLPSAYLESDVFTPLTLGVFGRYDAFLWQQVVGRAVGYYA